MRTTDVGRSGAPSFVCDVYAFNMTSHRLPVQVDQLIDIDLVTITKDTVGSSEKNVTYTVKGPDGVVKFAVVKKLSTDDAMECTSQREHVIKLHNPIVVQMCEEDPHKAEIQSPYDNVIGYINNEHSQAQWRI
ncbi:hypothetical protein LSH36_81g06044 [Paralvinella palmiformis]|uniref:Uncharacterized protein n=1 Tax=Paralvinella palmiformis TaxID=53620 RepID=A0AAD9NCB9_9ANNE|nr:hypothetical protein LSH36_81g06044 [Paralvinella palmiformis]